jgi:DNA helicase-2/ATP-dependent DNA helicase PcrA
VVTVVAAKIGGDMTSISDPSANSATPIILDGRQGPVHAGGASFRAGGCGDDDDMFAGLNPQQRVAAEYRGAALLIVAGAGSGKTSVLTRRIAGLIQSREAWPSQILAITFTNKAAAEMRERVAALLGGASQGMWISTFHSACVRILRREAEVFGYASGFTIYDSGDSRALLKRII